MPLGLLWAQTFADPDPLELQIPWATIVLAILRARNAVKPSPVSSRQPTESEDVTAAKTPVESFA